MIEKINNFKNIYNLRPINTKIAFFDVRIGITSVIHKIITSWKYISEIVD